MAPAVNVRRDRLERRRGAALLLVLIFGIMSMVIVLTLLSLGDTNLRGQAIAHEQLALHAVLRAGIAESINEINATRLDGGPPAGNGFNTADPGNDGQGALTYDEDVYHGNVAGSGDGLRGVRVFGTDPDAGGPLTAPVLGRFCSHIQPLTNGANRLWVVAANYFGPEQANRPRYVVSARVEIERGRPPFPANAISLNGDVNAGVRDPVGNAAFDLGGGTSVEVEALEYTVPAINVTDTTALAEVMTHKDGLFKDADIDGLDPTTGVAVASGDEANTITNDQAGIISENTMQDIVDAIDDRVAACTPGNTDPATGLTVQDLEVAINAQLPSGVTLALNGDNLLQINNNVTLGSAGSPGVYRLDGGMELEGKTLTGFGTLIVTDDLKLDNGTMNWTGDIIIVSAGGNSAHLLLDGSKPGLTVNGVLAVQAYNTNAILEIDHSALTVNGGFTVLSGEAGGSGTIVGHSSDITVTGICAFMGNNIDFATSPGGAFVVDGSLAVTVPPGADQGMNIDISNGSNHTKFSFHQATFDQGLNALGAFFDPNGKLLPISATKYWEGSSARADHDLQGTAIPADATTTAAVGIPGT